MIAINENGGLLANEQETNLEGLPDRMTAFIKNEGKNPRWADSPEKVLVNIQYGRKGNYDDYIKVLDQIKGGYAHLREYEAEALYDKSYKELEEIQQKNVDETYPEQLSETLIKR